MKGAKQKTGLRRMTLRSLLRGPGMPTKPHVKAARLFRSYLLLSPLLDGSVRSHNMQSQLLHLPNKTTFGIV